MASQLFINLKQIDVNCTNPNNSCNYLSSNIILNNLPKLNTIDNVITVTTNNINPGNENTSQTGVNKVNFFNKMQDKDLTENKMYIKLFKDDAINKSKYTIPRETSSIILKNYNKRSKINSSKNSLNNLNLNLKNHFLSLLSLNIRSLENKIDSFNMLLKDIDISFDVITLNETWLSHKSVSKIDLQNYNFIAMNRPDKRDGGLAMYISDKYNFFERKDLYLNQNINNVTAEIQIIEINEKVKQSKHIIIINIYRPPNKSCDNFIKLITELIITISKENKICYITGDVNINLLNDTQDTAAYDLIANLLSFNFHPIITKATRVTKNSMSLLDIIFTNNKAYSKSAIIISDISDHFPVAIFQNYTLNKVKNST